MTENSIIYGIYTETETKEDVKIMVTTSEASEHERNNKHIRTILTIVQSCLICILIVLVVLMMIEITKLQGTARVVNYAGLVRGATQRLVKLEMSGNPNDELVCYLDEILKDLKYGDGDYMLVSLDDDSYQENLDSLMLSWECLKRQIEQVRVSTYETANVTELLEMSEEYFRLADETVSAAEVYSDKIARQIRMIELVTVLDMCLLLCMIVEQTVSAMRMLKKNRVLEQKAYIDTHTGLQNKNRCEELLADRTVINEPTACLMFDINNLKHTNDTLGHLVGDRLIADFARILRSVVREKDFAGRCGGDEFMVVLYGVEEKTVESVITRLHTEIEHFNSIEKNVPISYAHGWAVSTDYKACMLRTLFDAADHCMYMNKRRMKECGSSEVSR